MRSTIGEHSGWDDLSQGRDLYQDLSSVLVMTKKAVSLLECWLLKDRSTNQTLKTEAKVTELLTELRTISRHYHRDGETQLDPITLHRFSNRLLEFLTLQLIKLRNTDEAKNQCSKVLEELVAFVKQSSKLSLALFVDKIVGVLGRILTDEEDQLAPSTVQGQKTMPVGTIERVINSNRSKAQFTKRQRKGIEYDTYSSSEQESDEDVWQSPRKTSKNIRVQLFQMENMPTIHKQFTKFRDLDLDFNWIKNANSHVKYRYDFVYNEFISRNTVTMRTINQYKKDFQKYATRSNLRLAKKKASRKSRQKICNSKDRRKQSTRYPAHNFAKIHSQPSPLPDKFISIDNSLTKLPALREDLASEQTIDDNGTFFAKTNCKRLPWKVNSIHLNFKKRPEAGSIKQGEKDKNNVTKSKVYQSLKNTSGIAKQLTPMVELKSKGSINKDNVPFEKAYHKYRMESIRLLCHHSDSRNKPSYQGQRIKTEPAEYDQKKGQRFKGKTTKQLAKKGKRGPRVNLVVNGTRTCNHSIDLEKVEMYCVKRSP